MNRRTFLMAMAVPPVERTAIAIDGDKFRINGKLTYAGRPKVEGMLLNTRMVQGIFDDRNAVTRERWKYPDTGKWNGQYALFLVRPLAVMINTAVRWRTACASCLRPSRSSVPGCPTFR